MTSHKPVFVLLALSIIALIAAACGGGESTSAPPAVLPTPDIQATVDASIQTALAGVPTPVPLPTAQLAPTLTPLPTPDIEGTVTIRVQATIRALPIPTTAPTPNLSGTVRAATQATISALPTPTLPPTQSLPSPTVTTTPSPTPSPTPTPMPEPTSSAYSGMTATFQGAITEESDIQVTHPFLPPAASWTVEWTVTATETIEFIVFLLSDGDDDIFVDESLADGSGSVVLPQPESPAVSPDGTFKLGVLVFCVSTPPHLPCQAGFTANWTLTISPSG